MTELSPSDKKKMEMLDCLNIMWDMFCRHIEATEDQTIEQFINAKDRAHQLLAEIGRNGEKE